jgi:uncharacterized protein (TIGR02145 family)
MRISILQGSATGTPVYVETQSPIANANGLVTIEIGGGTSVNGTFVGIDWSTGIYFVKTETDPTGGTSYSITGINQILSVPFSMYAKKAATAEDGVKITGDQSIAGTKTFTGTIDADSHTIVNVANPLNEQDAATKAYVDNLASQIEVLSNTIKAGGYVTDIDGNTYSTVKIGSRIWMAENLKVTKFNDGTDLRYASDLSNMDDGYHVQIYSWYNFDPVNKDIYGALYTGGAVIALGKNMCPVGWHPSDSPDWLDMLKTLDPNARNDFFNCSHTAGAGLKSTGTLEAGNGYWHEPNTGATNESGFRALPGGEYWEGIFRGMSNKASFWVRTTTRNFSYSDTEVRGTDSFEGAHSVRCVKDL